MIPFNKPLKIRSKNIFQLVEKNNFFSGDGPFTKKCHQWLENYYSSKALITTSGTHALEMSAMLCNIQPGDEVIMPSYTFVSTANAFVNYGAKIKFIDIEPSTMNINALLIEQAITKKTKAIVAVHYGGVACDMNLITRISKKYNLFLIEDAAQAINAEYKGKKLGTFGDFACLSFHESKNIHCGEGGAIIVNNKAYFESAEVIREKGTNRTQFYRGQVDKYRWISKGSSYLPSEFNAAYLYFQLKKSEDVAEKRLALWNRYYEKIKKLRLKIVCQEIDPQKKHNGHLFFIKTKNLEERKKLIIFLKHHGIIAAFHYIPLHESIKCSRYNSFHGEDKFTTKESERILRLPMFYDLKFKEVDFIVKKIGEFYG